MTQGLCAQDSEGCHSTTAHCSSSKQEFLSITVKPAASGHVRNNTPVHSLEVLPIAFLEAQ